MIARLKIDTARTHLLSGFVDSYLTLLAQERQKLELELEKLPNQEREEVMEITTSWKEEGIQEGSIKILLRQLNKRVGKVDEAIQNKLASLSLKKLEKFSDSIFEFESDKDIELWFKKFAK